MAITLTRPETRTPEADAPNGSYEDMLPVRKRFTRDEYHLLPPEIFQKDGHRYELIAGDIIEKMGQKQPHIGLLLRWVKVLVTIFGIDNVGSQMPVVFADDTELEPDVSVSTRTNDTYLALGETTPAGDVRLIVEVSVSTRSYDAVTKALLYARGGIPDYWLLDVAARTLIVHRDPSEAGYATVVTLAENQSVAPLDKPDATFKVSDFLQSVPSRLE